MPTQRTDSPRDRAVCAACQGGLVHRLVTLHAGPDTLLVCSAIWDALPSYLREAFGGPKKNGGLAKRREVVEEIRDYITTNTSKK